MLIYPENEWNIYDDDGVMLPYYTHPSLEWIKNNISKDVSVLEIGGGNSTLWWRKNASEVFTIETDLECAKKLDCFQCSYLEIANSIDKLKIKFDVVIVDSEGDRECYILNAFNSCNKYFIVDNWQQSEVMIYSQEIVNFLYENTRDLFIFKQSNHKDWKTAVFIKK
jgi:hypothetical protein